MTGWAGSVPARQAGEHAAKAGVEYRFLKGPHRKDKLVD